MLKMILKKQKFKYIYYYKNWTVEMLFVLISKQFGTYQTQASKTSSYIVASFSSCLTGIFIISFNKIPPWQLWLLVTS